MRIFFFFFMHFPLFFNSSQLGAFNFIFVGYSPCYCDVASYHFSFGWVPTVWLEAHICVVDDAWALSLVFFCKVAFWGVFHSAEVKVKCEQTGEKMQIIQEQHIVNWDSGSCNQKFFVFWFNQRTRRMKIYIQQSTSQDYTYVICLWRK